MFDQDEEKTQPWFYDIKDFAAKFRASLLSGKKKCCPTCGRWNQVYHRPLNAAMCRQLILLWHAARSPAIIAAGGWVHVKEVVLDGTSGPGDFSKLKHWALIEPKEHREDDTKASGYWRITGAGVKFLTGQIALEETAKLLNDQLVGYAGKKLTIAKALKRGGFNYLQLMGDDHVADKSATA